MPEMKQAPRQLTSQGRPRWISMASRPVDSSKYGMLISLSHRGQEDGGNLVKFGPSRTQKEKH